MPLVFLNYVLELAGLAFLVASGVFLVWAFFRKRGLPRRPLLIASLSCLLLFVATAVSIYSLIFFVQLPAMAVGDLDFKPPWAGWNLLLYATGVGLTFVSVGLVAWALLRPRGARRRAAWSSLGCLVSSLAVGAANYSLVYSVQVPAMDRHVLYTPGTIALVGEQVPVASFTALDGTTVRLSELRGKVVVLNFFATWCGPCRMELPHLQQLWNDLHGNEEFAMLVVGREETPETVAAFKSTHDFTFPMAADSDGSAFRKFAEDSIPRTYVLSRDGTILFQGRGFAEIDFYQSEMARLRKIVDVELKNKVVE